MNESFADKLRRFLRNPHRFYSEWRNLHKQARFDKGYCYAKRLLNEGILTCEALYDHTVESETCGTYNDYDRGVRAAVYDWEQQNIEAL